MCAPFYHFKLYSMPPFQFCFCSFRNSSCLCVQFTCHAKCFDGNLTYIGPDYIRGREKRFHKTEDIDALYVHKYPQCLPFHIIIRIATPYYVCMQPVCTCECEVCVCVCVCVRECFVDVTKQPTCMKGSCCANNCFFTGSCKTNTQRPQNMQRERRGKSPGAPTLRHHCGSRASHMISSRARVAGAVDDE